MYWEYMLYRVLAGMIGAGGILRARPERESELEARL